MRIITDKELFFDPELPTKTMTPEEYFKKLAIESPYATCRNDKYLNPSYDKIIKEMYVEKKIAIYNIKKELRLSQKFVETRLNSMGIMLTDRRKERKSK